MKYQEIKRDLFTVSNNYYLAHCISSDFAMSGGIAVIFDRKFNLKEQFKTMDEELLVHPTCILIGRVFNLITKSKVYHKPTYHDFTSAIKLMRDICIEKSITKIAMPKIGSGIDGLNWEKNREIINAAFNETDVEILICYID